MKFLAISSSIFSFFLLYPQESSPLSASQRQGSSNRVNIPRTCWAKLFGPRIHLRRSSTNTPNHIREAKVCPIKNQLYSPNTPNYVREQIFAQLRPGLRHSSCKSSTTHSIQCVLYLCVSKWWYGCQHPTQSTRTKSDPGWFCTIWSGLPVEEYNVAWMWETGRRPVAFCQNQVWWFLHAGLLLDQMHLAKTWPGHPDRIWAGFAQYNLGLLWKNKTELDAGSRIQHTQSGLILAAHWPQRP